MDKSSENLWLIDTSYSFIDSIAFDYLFRNLNIVAITCIGTINNHTSSIKEKIQKHINSINSSLNIEVYEGSNIPFINYQKELKDEMIINPYEIKNFEAVNESVIKSNENFSLENVAAVKILEFASKYGKKLNILSLGPLTNLALSVLIDSSLADKINSLIVTGGSTNNWGNSGNAAEYNFRYDPVATKNIVKYFTKNKLIVPLEIDRELSSRIFNEEIAKQIKNKETAEKFRLVIQHLKEKTNESEFEMINFNCLSLFSSLYAINQKILTNNVVYPSDVDIVGRLTRGILVMEKYNHVISGKCVPTNFAVNFDVNLVIDLILI